jgi:hypothetical protein
MKHKIEITFWQRCFEVPILWVLWRFHASPEKRMPWYLVLKGIEKHTCNFTKPHFEQGWHWLMCDHEGCNTVISNDAEFLRPFKLKPRS